MQVSFFQLAAVHSWNSYGVANDKIGCVSWFNEFISQFSRETKPRPEKLDKSWSYVVGFKGTGLYENSRANTNIFLNFLFHIAQKISSGIFVFAQGWPI